MARAGFSSALMLLASCAGATSGSTEERPTSARTTPEPTARPARSEVESPPPDAEPRSLELTMWTDMPVQLHRLGDTTLAGVAGDLAIVRDGRLQQDALLTRVPNCTRRGEDVAGDITSLAGRWPDGAFMTRVSEDDARPGTWVYRWKSNAWAVVRRVDDPRAQLLDRPGAVLLANRDRGGGGYELDSVLGKAPPPTPASSGSCKTELATLAAAVTNTNGDLLAWGTGCGGQATLEWFAPQTPPAISTWDAGTISVAGFSAGGDPTVAIGGDEGGSSDVLVRHDGAWTSTGRIAGRVTQLATVDETTFALAEGTDGPTLWSRDAAWARRAVPQKVGSIGGIFGAGDRLWVTSEGGSFSTRPPDGEAWDWFRRGCDVPTFSRAKPYRNDPRGRTQNCPGEAFVLVGQTSDDTPPPFFRSWLM